MSKITCCIGCNERKLFCHSSCEKYLQEKSLHDATKALINERRNEANVYDSYHAERLKKFNKK